MQIFVKIATLHGVFIKKEAYMTILPAFDGEVGIITSHEPFIFRLNNGLVKLYEHENRITDKIFIFCGFAQVYNDKVDIVTENAMNLEDLDIKYTTQKIIDLEKELLNSEEEAHAQLLQKKLELHRTMLEVSQQK